MQQQLWIFKVPTHSLRAAAQLQRWCVADSRREGRAPPLPTWGCGRSGAVCGPSSGAHRGAPSPILAAARRRAQTSGIKEVTKVLPFSAASWSPEQSQKQAERKLDSEVLLSSFLRIHCIQNGLPFRSVSLTKLFYFSFHHGVQCF